MSLNPRTDSEVLRRDSVRQMFLARCPSGRTVNDVLTFFRWLNRRCPDLLPPGKLGDPYQHLKVDLIGLYLHESEESRILVCHPLRRS
jgi:hypothetical protein